MTTKTSGKSELPAPDSRRLFFQGPNFFFFFCSTDELRDSEPGDEDAEMKDATAKAKSMAKTIKAQGSAATKEITADDDNDLAAYNLDDYDNEESKGTGEESIRPGLDAWR